VENFAGVRDATWSSLWYDLRHDSEGDVQCSQLEKAFGPFAKNSASPCAMWRTLARASRRSIAMRNSPFLPAACRISRPREFCQVFTGYTRYLLFIDAICARSCHGTGST